MQRFQARGSVDKNKRLVEQLRHHGVIKSKEVAEVMETVDRGLFISNGASAYVDSPMLIGYNATISAPHMHATCLELLRDHLQPGMRVLDVGSGATTPHLCSSRISIETGARPISEAPYPSHDMISLNSLTMASFHIRPSIYPVAVC